MGTSVALPCVSLSLRLLWSITKHVTSHLPDCRWHRADAPSACTSRTIVVRIEDLFGRRWLNSGIHPPEMLKHRPKIFISFWLRKDKRLAGQDVYNAVFGD